MRIEEFKEKFEKAKKEFDTTKDIEKYIETMYQKFKDNIALYEEEISLADDDNFKFTFELQIKKDRKILNYLESEYKKLTGKAIKQLTKSNVQSSRVAMAKHVKKEQNANKVANFFKSIAE